MTIPSAIDTPLLFKLMVDWGGADTTGTIPGFKLSCELHLPYLSWSAYDNWKRGLHYLVNCKDPDYAVFWNSSDSKKWNPDRCGSLKHFECYDFYRQINLSWIYFYLLIWNVQRHKFDEWVGRFINSPVYLSIFLFVCITFWVVFRSHGWLFTSTWARKRWVLTTTQTLLDVTHYNFSPQIANHAVNSSGWRFYIASLNASLPYSLYWYRLY